MASKFLFAVTKGRKQEAMHQLIIMIREKSGDKNICLTRKTTTTATTA